MLEDPEMVQAVEAFKDYFREIIKNAGKDATLALVEVDKLTSQELILWREYQGLLKFFKDHTKNDQIVVQEEMESLLQRIEDFLKKSKSGWSQTKNRFYPWFTNRLGILLNGLQVIVDHVDDTDFKENIKFISDECDRYASIIV